MFYPGIYIYLTFSKAYFYQVTYSIDTPQIGINKLIYKAEIETDRHIEQTYGYHGRKGEMG